MLKIVLGVLISALSATSFTTFANEGKAQQSVRFYVDASLESRVGNPLMEHRVNSWIKSNNKIFEDNGVAIERVPTSYSIRDLTADGSFGVYGLFNRLGASQELRQRFGLGGDHYTVFVVDAKEVMGGCSIASSNDPKHKFAVLAFDLTGVCSHNYMMAHELGHNDGLEHTGSRGGGMCPDSSFSIMATSMSDGRRHLMGADSCPSKNGSNDTPYAVYKKLEKILDPNVRHVPIEFVDSLEMEVEAYQANGLYVFLKPEYLRGFSRKVVGTYYLTFPKDSSTSFGQTDIVELQRVSGGLLAKVTLSQKKSFLRALGQRMVYWIDDKEGG